MWWLIYGLLVLPTFIMLQCEVHLIWMYLYSCVLAALASFTIEEQT